MNLAVMIEQGLSHFPWMGRWYCQRGGRLKRQYCLLLAQWGRLKPATFVQWLATYQCNYSCPFCEASAGRCAPDELTTEEARALIDDLAAMGLKRFLISGGEPFQRPDLPVLLKHASEKSLQLGVVTNGYYISQHWKQLKGLRWFLYFTSLDGLEKDHDRWRGVEGSFSRALDALRLVADIHVPVRMVNTVVHENNIDQMAQLIPILRSHGVTHWHLTPLMNIGRAQRQGIFHLSQATLHTLLEFVDAHQSIPGLHIALGESHGYLQCFSEKHVGKPFFCGAGLTRCSILPNGDVLGCHQVYDSRLAEGNIRKNPFSQIWKEGFQRFRQPHIPSACTECQYLDQCQGGCWAEMEKQGQCLKPLWEGRITTDE